MLALSKEETISIYDDYVGFYDEFADIEAYYRYKKRKRMEELPSSLPFPRILENASSTLSISTPSKFCD